MTTTGELFALAEAAIEFDVARRVALRLKEERNACQCERENHIDETPLCWKRYEWSSPDDTERLSEG